MSWNDSPEAQPLACAAGIYIQSLGKCLNPNAKGVFRYPELVSDLLKDKQRIPSHNYLPWAFHEAFSDKGLFPFVKELEIENLFCEQMRKKNKYILIYLSWYNYILNTSFRINGDNYIINFHSLIKNLQLILELIAVNISGI